MELLLASLATLVHIFYSEFCVTSYVGVLVFVLVLVPMVIAVALATATVFRSVASSEAGIVPPADPSADFLTNLKVALKRWIAHVWLLGSMHNDDVLERCHRACRHHRLLLWQTYHRLILLLHGHHLLLVRHWRCLGWHHGSLMMALNWHHHRHTLAYAVFLLIGLRSNLILQVSHIYFSISSCLY